MHPSMNIQFRPVDILIHAGDLTNIGELEKVDSVRDWLLSIPAKERIIIAGNHDLSFDPNCTSRFLQRLETLIPISEFKSHIVGTPGITYLEESGVELMGLKFWGTPFSPFFCNWAFQIPEGEDKKYFDKIPENTDIVISHGPPYGVLDKSQRGVNCGSQALYDTTVRISPALLVFGHIHEARGVSRIGKTLCVNPSLCTMNPSEHGQPIYVDIMDDF